MSDPSALRLSSSHLASDTCVVAIAGELDLHGAKAVHQQLTEMVDGGARSVVVDLLGLTMIDSSGLGVVIDTGRAVRSSGGDFVLVADHPGLTRLMEITGLDRTFAVETSLTDAMDHLVDRQLAS